MEIKKLELSSIDMIEGCPEVSADKYAFMKRINFKGCFNLYFIDFGGYFGKSMLVYRNGRQIKWENDYELHHRLGWSCYRGEPEFFGVYNLIKLYLDEAKNNLFSDEEILQERIKSYDEYRRKQHYVMNDAVLMFDHVSTIYITNEQKAKVQSSLARLKNPVKAPKYLFSYVSGQEAADYLENLLNAVESQYDKLLDDNEVFREAVSYELANHEACITGSCSEALSALGLSYNNLPVDKQVIVRQELHEQMMYCA